jgi:hypothetical protein
MMTTRQDSKLAQLTRRMKWEGPQHTDSELDLIRIATLNIGRDIEHKIDDTLKYLTNEDVDICILTETCEGTAIQTK